MSDTGAEAAKPDPGCSWEGHFGWVGGGEGDENAECCAVVRPLRVPLVIRSLRRTYVVIVRKTDELLCSGYKWRALIWDAVYLHSIHRWALSGADV